MEATIRRVTTADLPVLLELIREFYVFDGHPYDTGVLTRALTTLIEQPMLGGVWMMETDPDERSQRPRPEAVGYVVLGFSYSLEFHGRDAFVDELYLRAEHRGKGWGRRLLETALEAARAAGVAAVHLEVVRGNEPALGFYERAGFVDNNRYLMTKWFTGAITDRAT